MEMKKYYENPHSFSVNTKGHLLPFFPYANEEEALLQGNFSKQVTPLSQNWAYYTFDSLSQIPKELFSQEHPLEAYTTRSLPFSLEQEDFPLLIDPPHLPSALAVQVFAKNLTLHRADDGLQRILTLQEVYNGCYIYVNGGFVGFHGQAGTAVSFDLTPYLQNGSNRLVLVVTALSAVNYLVPANHFGILGKVYLLTRKAGGVQSLSVSYDLPVHYKTANLLVEVNALCPEEVTLCLYTPRGELLYKHPVGSDGICRFTLESPVLWSDETPECYTIVALCQGEVTRHPFGLRNLRMEETGLFVNGRKIPVKGVSYSCQGKGEEELKQELLAMKAHHVNTVALTCFPSQTLLELCDQYGMYVIAHSGVHTPYLAHCSHNFVAGDLTFRELLIHRMESLVAQSNHPCVIARCVGEDCGVGSNVKFALDTLRQLDEKTPAFCGGVTPLEADLVVCKTEEDIQAALQDGRPYLCYHFPKETVFSSLGTIAGDWNQLSQNALELQGRYCPIGVELKDGATGELVLTNQSNFTYFTKFECFYEVTRYGKVVDRGFGGIFSLPPTATETVQLDYHLPSEGECALHLTFAYLGDTPYAKSGDLAGRFWFPLPVSPRRNTAPVKELLPELIEKENELHIYAAGCHYTLSTLLGQLTQIEYHGKTLLLGEQPSSLQFGCRGVTYSVKENCILITAQLKVGQAGLPPTATLTKKFGFYGDGCVTVEPTVTPHHPELFRKWLLDSSLTHLHYYGFGPAQGAEETTPGCYLGHFSMPLEEQPVKEAKGKLFRLTNGNGLGLALFNRDALLTLSAEKIEGATAFTLSPNTPFIMKPVQREEDLWHFYNNTYQPID